MKQKFQNVFKSDFLVYNIVILRNSNKASEILDCRKIN